MVVFWFGFSCGCWGFLFVSVVVLVFGFVWFVWFVFFFLVKGKWRVKAPFKCQLYHP